MNISQKFIAQRDAQTDDGVIPLINVVFLMLIFFMVAGQIQKADPIAVEPPQSINEAKNEHDPEVVLFAGLDGSWFFNDEQVELESITPKLVSLFEQSENPNTFSIQIKADGSIPVEKLAPLFSQIKQAGLTKVSIATQLHKG